MFTIYTLPKSIPIERDQPGFAPLVETIELMEAAASGADRSTTDFVPAGLFAALATADAQTHFVLVTLPASAEPHAERLTFGPLLCMTHGWHLGERRVCLAFEQFDLGIGLYVDANRHIDTLVEVEEGRAHLVLAVACGQMLYLRLLDEALRLDDSDDAWSNLGMCISSVVNFRPYRVFSDEALDASFAEANAKAESPYDASLLSFQPVPLQLAYDEEGCTTSPA